MREDIFEGIKLAVSKGENLQSAMQSFYNAGYKKEEIEEAARAFQMWQAGHPVTYESPSENPEQIHSEINSTSSPSQQVSEKPKGFFEELIGKIIPSSQTNQNKPSEKESPQKIIMILLGAVLFLLIFALIGVLIFKKDIVRFLTGKIIQMLS